MTTGCFSILPHRLHPARGVLGALLFLALTVQPGAAREAYYTSAADAGLVHVLPAPPAPDSDVAKADLEEVLKAQAARTETQILAVRADQLRSVFQFSDAMGPGFKSENLPFATKFFKHVARDAKRDVTPVKAAYDRPRPPAVDPRVQTVTRIPRDSSYPSAHSTFASLMGTLLIAMAPERTKDIEARAQLYAYHRVIAGAHFPSDVRAGALAGKAIAARMMQNPKFVTDFNRAKAEVRAALDLK